MVQQTDRLTDKPFYKDTEFPLKNTLQNLFFLKGLAITDIVMLSVWGAYYCIPYLLRELPFSDETWNRWMEPLADLCQTFAAYFLVAIAIDIVRLKTRVSLNQ